MDPKEASASSEQEAFEQPKIQTHEQMVSPESHAEKIILESEQQQSKKTSKSILSQDIELKLEQVLEDIQQEDGKNFQSIITLRMKELAYSKILVFTYEKSYFRLVQAHFHIGRQYLKFKCYEQALNHLITAIDKNVKATESSTHKLFHSYLLTYLGQCLYYIQKYEEAQRELSRALNIQQQCEEKDKNSVSNIDTLKFLALVKVKLNQKDALSHIQKASARAKESLGEKSRQYGLILYEEGKYNLEKGKPKQAIQLYNKAIEAIQLSNEADGEEDIIKIYQQLAQIHESNNPEQYIETLKLKYMVFEETYGNADKKSIKQQRNLVTALLRHKKIEESLEECEDILQKQKRVYGENSLEVGKQHRTIANIYLAKHDFKQADTNYKKAMKIFHDLGDQRLAREVKVKIASLQIQQKQ